MVGAIGLPVMRHAPNYNHGAYDQAWPHFSGSGYQIKNRPFRPVFFIAKNVSTKTARQAQVPQEVDPTGLTESAKGYGPSKVTFVGI